MKASALSKAELAEGWRKPGSDAGWLNPIVERFLLHLLVKKELRVRYRGSVLGMAWSYAKPAVQFAVFYLALGVFLQLNKNMPAYAVYLFAGIVVINLFGEMLGNCTRSISANAPLVAKIYLPAELFPWSSALVALVHFIPQVLVLAVGALLYGWRPGIDELFWFGAGMSIIGVFTIGLGMIAAALNAAFRDVENFVDLIVMVATWTSPILYPIAMVKETIGGSAWWALYSLNPITIAVECFHSAFWRDMAPGQDPGGAAAATIAVGADVAHLWWAGALIAVTAFLAGTLVFEHSKRSFAQEL